MVTLDKAIVNTADEAIIYMLKRLAIEGEGWTEDSLQDIHIVDFGSFVLSSGYLAQANSRDISIRHFLENFNEIKQGIFKEAGSALYMYGVEISKELPLAEEELISATCFSDEWNNRQYFVEGTTEWILFTWATSV